MTVLDLDAIKARAEAATPGPWFIGQAGFDRARRMIGARFGNMDVGFLPVSEISRDPEFNSQFIAAARTDVPALVAEVERLQAFVDDLVRYGIRFDLNPTVDGSRGAFAYVEYIGRIDQSIRERASAVSFGPVAIESSDLPTPEREL